MATVSGQSFVTVGTTAVLVNASPAAPARVFNLTGGTMYYAATSAVSASDTSVANGSSHLFYSTGYIISASTTKVLIENYVTTPSAISAQRARYHTWQATAATSGTDSACTNGTIYVGSIWVDEPFLVTGVRYLIGSVGGTDKVITSLHNSLGEVVGNSDTSGTTVGTAANEQSVAFTSPVTIPGPDKYYVGVTFNGTTAKFRTVPAHTSLGIHAGSTTQTFGTVAAITVPTTFTADKCPVASLY